jgi:hypothetical protein
MESLQVREWQAEASREKAARYLRQALQLRFDTAVPEDLQAQIAAIQEEAELDRWFDASLTAPSLDDFRAAVQNGKRKRKRSL